MTMSRQKTSHFNIAQVDKAHMRLIAKLVCEHVSLPINKLFANTRIKPIVSARQIFFYFCSQYLDDVAKSSLSHAPQLWNSDRVYNHATVLHAIKQTENYIFSDVRFKQDMEKLRCEIEIAVMKSDEISNSLKIKKASQAINMMLKELEDPFYAEYLVSKLKNLIDERRNQDLHQDSGLDMVQKPIHV